MSRRLLSTLALAVATTAPAFAQDAPVIDPASTAWMLISTALVLLMTPALAFFYGGLVRTKNVLNTMLMSFAALGFVAVAWFLLGYSIAFGNGTPFFGDFTHLFLNGVGLDATSTGIPNLLFMAYQGTFCIITAALISGAVVERMKFPAYVVFITLWSLVVYAPVAHWVWAGTGWLFTMGALDFAGGTVVHINAAVAAVAAVIAVKSRKDYGRSEIVPHNVPFVLLGAGLLWFGWFGFNGGSALASGASAALAFVNTMIAPAATLVVWKLLDFARHGKPASVGAATAIVVGLVAITPAAGHVSPTSALLIGAIAALPSYFGILLRGKTKFDDSLDVFAAHGLGGITGALLTGVFADSAWSGMTSGLLAGNPGQMIPQIVGIGATIVYSFVVSFGLLKLIGLVMPLRASDDEEEKGLDNVGHNEEGYIIAEKKGELVGA